MSDIQLPPALAKVAASGKISADDVRMMRGTVFADDKMDRDEAEMLLALDKATDDNAIEWRHFFGEALVTYIVHQEKPEGSIGEDNANWFIERVSHHGLVDSPERFEMLVKVIETAKSSPPALMEFALEQVKQAVLENQGAVVAGRAGEAKVICKSDVELIRRLIFGFGGEGGMAISHAEAEFLFDLNDATLEHENDPAWSDLFVRAIGGYLLATLGNTVPTRVQALEADEWLEGGTLIDKLVNSLRSAYRAALSPQSVTEDAIAANNAALQQQARTAEVVTSEEADWLAERIGKDGVFHENEQALIRFIAEESHDLHPSLREWVEKAS